jgi:hypothetical protein
LNGNNFYRLKMEDRDGHFTYSPVVAETIDAVSSVYLVYPNPVRGSASLLFAATNQVRYAIKVTDQNGKNLSELTGTTLVGSNKVDIDLHTFAAGVYTISVAINGVIQQSLQVNKK